MKNRIFKIIFITFIVLSSFVYTKFDSISQCAFGEQTAQTTAQTVQTAQTQSSQTEQPVLTQAAQPQQAAQAEQSAQSEKKSQNVTQQSIPQKNYNQLKKIGKNTYKNKLFKFVIALFGVIISALIIFFGLKFYKNFGGNNNNIIHNNNNNKSLESPKDFKEAINLFLNKTEI